MKSNFMFNFDNRIHYPQFEEQHSPKESRLGLANNIRNSNAHLVHISHNISRNYLDQGAPSNNTLPAGLAQIHGQSLMVNHQGNVNQVRIRTPSNSQQRGGNYLPLSMTPLHTRMSSSSFDILVNSRRVSDTMQIIHPQPQAGPGHFDSNPINNDFSMLSHQTFNDFMTMEQVGSFDNSGQLPHLDNGNNYTVVGTTSNEALHGLTQTGPTGEFPYTTVLNSMSIDIGGEKLAIGLEGHFLETPGLTSSNVNYVTQESAFSATYQNLNPFTRGNTSVSQELDDLNVTGSYQYIADTYDLSDLFDNSAFETSSHPQQFDGCSLRR